MDNIFSQEEHIGLLHSWLWHCNDVHGHNAATAAAAAEDDDDDDDDEDKEEGKIPAPFKWSSPK